MGKFCCDIMEYQAIYDKKVLDYDSSMRSYSIILYDNDTGDRLDIVYCPWCGYKLKTALHSEWDRILDEEYGIKEPFFEDKDRVPPEFWTDEWWKKRSL